MVTERPWGTYELLKQENDYWVKILTVKANSRLSFQSHENRDEIWIIIKGNDCIVEIDDKKTSYHLKEKSSFYVKRQMKHRIWNHHETDDLVVCEIALGQPDENDIKRYEDDYGRN